MDITFREELRDDMKRKVMLIVGIMTILTVMLLCCGFAMAEVLSGTYDGMDWSLNTSTGFLTLGTTGETQTLVNNSTRNFRNWPWHGNRSSIVTVETRGNLVLQGSLDGIFYNCSQLRVADVSRWNTQNVTNMSRMFCNCGSLTYADVSGFDTSNVTDMSSMFSGCSSLTSLNVSGFVTSKVSNVSCMFEKCSGLTSLDVSGFDTTNVTNMVYMFKQCSGLTFIDTSGFDTSKVTNMNEMFYYCGGLTSLDVSGFETSNVKNMSSMFSGCKNVTLLNVSDFNTSKVTNMSYMFSGCSGLITLDLSGFDTSHITNINNMFYKCTGLTSVILGDINPFKGAGTSVSSLPTPPAEQDGIAYTGKWIREDGTYGPYTSVELRNNYTSIMAGKWVWEKAPTEYMIFFVCDEENSVGSMPPVMVEAAEDYTLPSNAFRVFGYVFDHWTDDTRRTWEDNAIIPANTYAVGAEVTLTAVFEPRDRSISMQDGSFDFSIKGNEKALFQPIPASISYQVYEQTPFGWNLIKQSNNTGIIMPDEESEALFLNKYDPLKVTIRFAGTKLMDESAAEPDSFNFLLYEDETLIDIASVSEGGAIEFQPIEYEVAGDHHYYIKEVIGNDNTVEYDAHVEEITVSITSDGIGHLSADVTMDEDQILFENKSKPGMLVLRKLNATTEDRDGVFYYEVQFSSENGQPYDLLSSDISYEEREGDISEFPETQPWPEKPKYLLTVHHVRTDAATRVETSYHSVGDIVTVNADYYHGETGFWGDHYVYDYSEPMMFKGANNTLRYVMPDGNLDVHINYKKYIPVNWRLKWQGKDANRPEIQGTLFIGEDPVTNMVMSEAGTPANDGDIIDGTFGDWPGSWTGSSSVYPSMIIDSLGDDDQYYLLKQSTTLIDNKPVLYVDAIAGVHGQVYWDDNNNASGLRPDSVEFTVVGVWYGHSSINHTARANAVNDWAYVVKSDNEQFRNYSYTLSVSDADVPAGYKAVTSAEDPTLGALDIRFELANETTLDTAAWTTYVNGTGGASSLPLRSATSFERNTTYASINELPSNAVKIDNAMTAYSVYFWNEGTDCYWWSDADIIYLPQLASSMFIGCDQLVSLDLSEFDASKAQYMDYMFDDCDHLTNLNVTGWNTMNVTNMSYMFNNCSSLTSLDVSSFNTSNVANMSHMFANCSGLTELNIDGLDTKNVTRFSGMFYNCSGIASLDVSGFDTAKAEYMDAMFFYCQNLATLDVSDFETSNVVNMEYMFTACPQLTSLDVSGFDTSHVTTTKAIFYRCSGLTELAVAGWDMSKVTTMSAMFAGCAGLTSLDLSGWNTDSLKTVAAYVQYAPSSSSNSYEGLFTWCEGLTELNLSGWNMSQVTNLYSMFQGCSQLVSLDLSDWDVSNTTGMYSLFYGCSALTDIDLSAWNTVSVKDISYMFFNCVSLTNVDLSSWNTPNLINMSYTFSGCTGLANVNLVGIDTSHVTTFGYMFRECSNLVEIDLSSFETSAVTDMRSMFAGCRNVGTIYVSDGWTTDSVEESSRMFYQCLRLKGGRGTAYINWHEDKAYARVDGGLGAPGYFTYKAAPVQP